MCGNDARVAGCACNREVRRGSSNATAAAADDNDRLPVDDADDVDDSRAPFPLATVFTRSDRSGRSRTSRRVRRNGRKKQKKKPIKLRDGIIL